MVVAAARHGLPSEVACRLPAISLTSADAEAVRACCRTDRLSGLLAGAVSTGEVQLAGGDVDAIVDDWHQALRACVIVEALLVRTADRLQSLGVRWALTKGAAVAHLDFPDPSLRCFADVDLVVHPEDWPSVLTALAGEAPQRRAARAFTDRYGKGETVLVDDMELDLHRRFSVGRFGVRAAMAECFDQLDSVALAGRSIPALAPAYRLLHGCFHAALGGNPGLRAGRDVVQIATSHPGHLDEMWVIARRWNVEAVVARAVLTTWQQLRLVDEHPLAERARSVTVSPADRRALDLFARDPRFRPQALSAWGALPWRDRLPFVRAAWALAREARR